LLTATFKDLHIENSNRSGKNAIGSIRWQIPENPSIGAKISQKSPTQAEL